jgi:hypothetical protein
MAALSPQESQDAANQAKQAKQAGMTEQQMLSTMTSRSNEFKNEASRVYRNTSAPSSNNTNTTQGSITNPFDVIKSGSGSSKISEMSDQYKTGINNEFEIKTKMEAAILKQLEIESNLHTEINESLSITGRLSESFRDTLIETLPAAAKLGYDIGNITDMVTTLSEKTSKFSLISSNTLTQSFDTARAFGMTLPQLSEAFAEFEKVGYGAADTLDKINDAGLESASLGLNARKTTQDLKTNIEKLNEYGFKNGVEGLNRMVQKAAEFRMNMAETFKVAEKVMNPESAIELTANMQMLGGAVGDLNDPLKLMYMATNNVEGLQDAIHGAASSLAVYNEEQGRFEIKGANLRRAKEMASQLGISYSEFAKGAIAAQERILATDTLLAKGFDLKDKDREFITNLSQMKDGEMQIVVPKSLSDDIKNQLGVGKDNEIKLSELTSEQIELLKSQRDALEGKTAEQMAQEMLTETKKMSNNLEAFVRSLAIQGKRQLLGKEGELLDGTDRIVPAFGEVLKTIKDLREDGLKMSQDPGRIGVAVKPIVDTVKEMGGYATGVIQSTKELIDVIRNEFIKGNETPKTKEQLKIEEENERRRERQKPRNDDGAFIGNLNIKLTKSGFGNDITIDQTEKGYLTPMRNMA